MSVIQYIKDTRGELHHVAWPTRVQTIVFTILVIVLSAFVAVYLGFFDYIFTTGLGKVVEVLPQASSATTQELPIDLNTLQLETTNGDGSIEAQVLPIEGGTQTQ